MSFLTERQQEILQFIASSLEERGVAPTLREISEAYGFQSLGSAQKHVALLVGKGYLRRVKHQKRGLLVVKPVPQQGEKVEKGEKVEQSKEDGQLAVGPGTSPRLPLLGMIAAGSPIESIAEPDTITVPPDLLRSGEHYVLRVRGESMIGEGIHDGDMVIVQKAVQAADGDMVVALLGGEVTLKRLFTHAAGKVRLQPSNPEIPALVVPARDVQVQGSVVGLMRRY